MINRRTFLGVSTVGVGALARAQQPPSGVPDSIRALKPMTDGVQPITNDERRARIGKARRLMAAQKIGGVYMERGSSMFYFTGTRNLSGLLIPVKGEIGWIVPAAEEQRAHDASRVGGKVFAYGESDGPFGVTRQALTDYGVSTGKIGLEEQVQFSVYDGLRKQIPSAEFLNATPVTAGCRMIKSKAEIALMQRAADVTIEAYRAGLATLREGMAPRELSGNIGAAYTALGFRGNVSVSFGKNTAFPHGSTVPQTLHTGDMILLDDGCSVDGYQSDITRAVVFGKPSSRQKQIWDLERKAQDAAFAAARLGATCESVDIAARKVITDAGFGPGYKLPGLPHRTGHGLGLDIHEWTYLVKGNTTRLEPGMCFSDEPMIVEGEFGVRLEDCIYMAEDGARFFSQQSPAIDQPFG
ncbi:Peptidase M24 [Candidatus Sulfopaludibacter sp. SbA3]|nr:Peptidase M24 [Candidatus Sulfopaludibacter sp. SbA3]